MFGLAHFRQEGAPLHPDDCDIIDPMAWTDGEFDKWQTKQLKRYNDYYKEPFND